MVKIYPSLISADLLNLEKEIVQLNPYVSGFHIDIMDFHFVPNLTMGPAFVKAISQKTNKQLWVHLMVDDPKKWIEILPLPPESIVSFHFESESGILNLIKSIKEKKWLPSIAISPKTDVEKIFPFLDIIYQVLVMSVEPGFSGQHIIKETFSKVQPLIGYRQTNNKLTFTIGMDGGINKKNIKELADLGVDDFAIASALFSQPDPVQALKELQQLVT